MNTNGSLKEFGLLVFLCLMSCTWNQVEPQVDCSISPVNLEILETKGTECGASNGSFMVNAVGGEQPYMYSSGATTNSDGIFSDIFAGNYIVKATDAIGCSSELEIVIENLSGVNLGDITVRESGCNSNNGIIQVSAIGGEEPYLYSLNSGAVQENNVFSGLSQGSYSVSIKDQSGCEITQNVNITSGISYQKSIKGIIETDCAISGCHNGSVSPNLISFSSIKSSANRIKARTANRSMPKGRTLSQQEIDLIACWVDDGAQKN